MDYSRDKVESSCWLRQKRVFLSEFNSLSLSLSLVVVQTRQQTASRVRVFCATFCVRTTTTLPAKAGSVSGKTRVNAKRTKPNVGQWACFVRFKLNTQLS